MNRALFAIAGAILSIAISPAAANAIRAELISVSCSATTGCVVGTNASSGPGVSGTSTKGIGVLATSPGSTYAMFAQSRNGIGLWSAAGSGAAVVASNGSAYSPTVEASQFGSGTAIAGTSKAGGNGVSAVSGSGTGLTADSTSGTALSANSANDNDGIYANSAQNWSLVAESSTGTGISAYAGLSNGRTAGVYAYTDGGTAIRAETASGYGILAESSGTGVRAQSEVGNGVDASGTYIGLIGRAPAQGFPLVATSNGSSVFFVDGVGNVDFNGNIGTFARTARGNVLAYGASATTRAVEDVGSSTLRSGLVRVALDATFARSIEGMGRYRIFLMPDGDTNGLFVAERDPVGFVVRETRGGRGSIAFDYRIVATTVGHGNERAAFDTERRVPHAPLQTTKPLTGRNGRAR